jgi:hypothetical protein
MLDPKVFFIKPILVSEIVLKPGQFENVFLGLPVVIIVIVHSDFL